MRNYLKQLRRKNGLIQEDIAKSLGCVSTSYSMIESGKRQFNMTYVMMEKLAAAFDVPVQDIIDAESAYKAAQQDSA